MLVIEIALGIFLGILLLAALPVLLALVVAGATGLLKLAIQLSLMAFGLFVVFATLAMLYTIDLFPWYINFVGGVLLGGLLVVAALPESITRMLDEQSPPDISSETGKTMKEQNPSGTASGIPERIRVLSWILIFTIIVADAYLVWIGVLT